VTRLAGITLLYALVAALAVAAPLAASGEPAVAPTEPATATPAQEAPAPATGTTTEAPTTAPAPAPPAPTAPASAQAPPVAPAAPAPPAEIRDTAPVEKPKAKDEPTALAAASTTVNIKDFEFGPSSVTVNVGDTVTWSNSGPTGHSATANDGSFDTGILAKGESGSHTFTNAGTFSYICKPHPFMKGTIVVAAASAGGQTGGDTGSSGAGGTADDTGSSAGAGPSSGTGSADSGASLPASGFDAGGLAVLGLATLLLGAHLRRRTATPQPRLGRIGW